MLRHSCSRGNSSVSRPRVTADCKHECRLVLWKVNIASATLRKLAERCQNIPLKAHSLDIGFCFCINVFIWTRRWIHIPWNDHIWMSDWHCFNKLWTISKGNNLCSRKHLIFPFWILSKKAFIFIVTYYFLTSLCLQACLNNLAALSFTWTVFLLGKSKHKGPLFFGLFTWQKSRKWRS